MKSNHESTSPEQTRAVASAVEGLATTTLQLTKKVTELTKEVSNLKKLEFMKVFTHPLKFLGYSLLKGIMIGFGSVLGASVLVALFIFLLTQIKLVPFVGDFVQKVIDEIQVNQIQGSSGQSTQSTQTKLPTNP